MARERDEQERNGKGKPEDRKLSALDRAILSALGDGRTVGREDDPLAASCPDVWEWLTKTVGGTDYLLQPAVLTIQLGPEGVLGTLTHRDLRRSVSVACGHVADVIPALQAELVKPNPAIKTWGKDEPHLRKRRQK